MDLSIILANWNTEKITHDALLSVIKNTKNIKFEIIVIDNASSDGSLAMLKKLSSEYKNIKVIGNSRNEGFGKANNQGLEKAKGEFVLLLNTDTIIHDNVLGEMVTWMKNNPGVGAASCALKNKDGSMQGTGGYFPTLGKVFCWMFFLEDVPVLDVLIKPFHPAHSASPIHKGLKIYESEKEMDWLTGAFIMIRRKVLEETGYFDSDYFMYSEEVDLLYRIKKAGWTVWYLPKWSITHLGGASSTNEYPILSEFTGIKTFYKKNMPGWQYPVLRIFLKSGAALRIILFGILKGKEAGATYAKAFNMA